MIRTPFIDSAESEFRRALRPRTHAFAVSLLLVVFLVGARSGGVHWEADGAAQDRARAEREAAAVALPEGTPWFGTGGPGPVGNTALRGPAAPPAEPETGFGWPAKGRITSIFDWEHPLGIDIGVRTGDPIVASAEGTIAFAGGTACCLYGLYVDVQHADGYLTRYAHLSEIRVTEGQTVSRGQLVGLGGNTGFSTGPHLHFELLHDGVIQDPMLFLR